MGSPCWGLAFFVLVVGTPAPLHAQEAPESVPQAPEAVPVVAPPEAPPEVPPAPASPTSAPGTPPPPVVAPPPTPVHAAPKTRGHVPAKPAVPRADGRRFTDAHVDRVLVLPTAETQPEGTLVLSSYDIALLQAGYALSDRTQITLTGTLPFGEVVPFDLALKSTLSRGARHRFAALGAVSGATGFEDTSAFVGRVGFVGQACLDAACRSSLNLGATAVLAGVVLIASGTGVVLGLSEHWSLVAEADVLLPTSARVGNLHGVVGGAGVRYSSRRWALDAGAFSPLDTRGTPVPLVAFSYRFFADP